jgi:glutathione S-transferase
VAQKLALAEGLPQIHADKIDVAAVYLYIILSWSKYVGVDLTPFPKLLAFSEKVAAHTAVAAAHTEMNAAP